MRLCVFDLTDGQPHRDDHGEYFENDDAVWREALRHARLIEDVLKPGGCWSLRVRTADKLIFQIDVTTKRL